MPCGSGSNAGALLCMVRDGDVVDDMLRCGWNLALPSASINEILSNTNDMKRFQSMLLSRM